MNAAREKTPDWNAAWQRAESVPVSGPPLPPPKGGLAPWVERRCRALIQRRLAENIGLDELAAEAGLSLFHFARMFKQSVGMPPRVYLTHLRLERACELLRQTNLSVTDVAQEVGYSSSQVLARVFIKHRRVSPSEYRRAMRGDGDPPGSPENPRAVERAGGCAKDSLSAGTARSGDRSPAPRP